MRPRLVKVETSVSTLISRMATRCALLTSRHAILCHSNCLIKIYVGVILDVGTTLGNHKPSAIIVCDFQSPVNDLIKLLTPQKIISWCFEFVLA